MPILHDVPQYSEEYDRLKLGMPTSSNFKKIITPTMGKDSASRKDYAYLLIAERMRGSRLETFQSEHMRRGMIEEAEAVEWYEFDQDVQALPIGFITDDANTMGCSPDRLVGNDGLLEVKCLSDKEFVAAHCEGKIDIRFRPQLQGQLYISQRKWVDILLWHRIWPKMVIRVWPDLMFVPKMVKALNDFLVFLENEQAKIITSGFVHVPQAKAALTDMLRASLGAVP